MVVMGPVWDLLLLTCFATAASCCCYLLLLLLHDHACLLLCRIAVKPPTMIICLGGVSGSSRSTLWRTHPLLQGRCIPCADIAIIYSNAEIQNRSITSPQAFQQLLRDVRTYLTENPGADVAVAVEAFFEPGGWQRNL
jgi:hypothetical protein